MKAATVDGWRAVRLAVFGRDRGCVATQYRVFGKDIAPDMCRDGYGDPVEWDAQDVLELDHVKEEIGGFKPEDDEAHLIAVCPWHHRLSQVWRSDNKAHRAAERTWLAKHYPSVWQVDSATA